MSQPSQLNINESIVAFSDVGLTNNPAMKHFDWSRSLNGLTVYSPKAEQYVVPPRTMLPVFATLRATFFDGTTQIQAKYMGNSDYRFQYIAGTDPVFAVNNPLTLVGASFTLAVLANQTVLLTASVGTPFAAVPGGSYIYIQSVQDNPASVFNNVNAGVWVVLGATGTSLTLARPTGTPFQALAETVTPTDNTNILSYTLSSVQVGDKVRLNSPFASGSRSTYVVTAVTSKWVDVTSATPIVEETILPGTTGMVFYASAKRFTRVETDQRAKVYFNGSNSENEELEPWQAGDRKFMAWQERIGPVWSLDVYNLSNVPMTVNVFTAE